ncbi:MAG TPA: hypothetical protein DDW27_12865 [Bacteroidales bacterium]|nr:hypothetical protein [Bacteroidales bacterium]
MKFSKSAALYLLKNKLYKDLNFTLDFLSWDKDSIRRFQNEKLSKLLDHARRNVPYYSEILENIKGIQDIPQIPFLTKKIIRERINDLKAVNFPARAFKSNSTSGSTGESMHFFSDSGNTYAEACYIRGDMMSGWQYGEKNVILWGALRDMNETENLLEKIKRKAIRRYEILSSFTLYDEKIAEYIRFINKFRPALIIGYPTGLSLMSEYMIRNGLNIYKPAAVISAGETLFDFQREIIEKGFGRKVFNRYGCREVSQIASECTAHDGLHISVDHLFVEILNEKGEYVQPGETGEIIVTDLDNYAFPLIRYKIGDMGAFKATEFKCSCGVNLPMLDRVEGRTMDVIVGPNGNRVTGSFWTLFFRHNFTGIDKFQVIQNSLNDLKLCFETNNSFRHENEQEIKSEIRKYLGDNINIEIEIVREIDKTSTGKHRWVISNMSPFV